MYQATKYFVVAAATLFACARTFAYEINNHADMSQTASERASLTTDIGNGTSGKLFRLGLKLKGSG